VQGVGIEIEAADQAHEFGVEVHRVSQGSNACLEAMMRPTVGAVKAPLRGDSNSTINGPANAGVRSHA
jgi:hypothetical protein